MISLQGIPGNGNPQLKTFADVASAKSAPRAETDNTASPICRKESYRMFHTGKTSIGREHNNRGIAAGKKTHTDTETL